MNTVIAGVILAGGRSRRMGGIDKAFIRLNGKPLIEWVIDRISPQVERLYVNTNHQHEKYKGLGYPLIADTVGPDIGPLAGILTGLESASSQYLLTAPCDVPLLPENLCAVLYRHLYETGARAATIYDGDKLHPVISLLDCTLAASLHAYLKAGHRSVAGWLDSIGVLRVDFPGQHNAFLNVNTPDDLLYCNVFSGIGRVNSVTAW